MSDTLAPGERARVLQWMEGEGEERVSVCVCVCVCVSVLYVLFYASTVSRCMYLRCKLTITSL